MRRRSLVLATLLAAALLPLRARAQGITAAPGGSMTSLVGMPLDVPIYVDLTGRTDLLGSFAARLQWNPAVLHFTGGSDGTFGALAVNEDSLPAGILHIAGANPAGVGGRVTVGVLHLTPLVNQPDTVHLTVTELFAAGTFADLLPSLSTRDGFYCPARGMYGDIDRDGSANSRDALIALSNAVGLDVSAFDITLGDVDANGVTNARDALIILTSAVGLPVGSFRVGGLAGGACSVDYPLAMRIVPDTVEMAIGQRVAFEARAADSSGALQTVTGAIWKSGNSAALAVFTDGTAEARDTGTVRVTAIRTALDSAQAVVRIVAHRRHIYVDAAAAGARNQLGSAGLPYGTIGQGTHAAANGDTIEVRVARYPEAVQLSGAVVLLGDTLADGTRPVVAVDTGSVSVGISLLGPGAQEVHNVAVDGFYDAVDLVGASHVVLAGLRASNVDNGVVVVDTTELLRIQGSRLVGGLASSRYGYGVVTDMGVDTLVIQGTEISDFGYDGVYANLADSLAVLRSHIHDVGGYAIYSALPSGCGVSCEVFSFGRLGLQPSVAFVMDSSTLGTAGSENWLVTIENFRSAVITHSRLIGGQYGSGVYLYNSGSGGFARFVGDSIDVPSSWIFAQSMDSLVVDSTAITTGSSYGDIYYVPGIRVTNSNVLTHGYAEPFYVYNFGVGGHLTVDNVRVTGDPTCDLCGYAFEVYYATMSANRLAVANTYYGLYTDGGDSAFTITNSVFRHVEYPIEWYGGGNDSLQVKVANTTFDGFYDAIYASGFGAVLDSNTFLGGGGTGVYLTGAYKPVWITRNRFASVYNPISVSRLGAIGVFADSVTDNVTTDQSGDGIYFNADSTAPLRVLRNSLTCNATGGAGAHGILFEYADGIVANNQVTGCNSGIWAYATNQFHADTLTGNTVVMPQHSYVGIYAYGPLASVITGNAVSGDTSGSSSYGALFVDHTAYGTGTTQLANNAVAGGSGYGIFVSNLDSAFVRNNTVQGVGNGGTATGILAGNNLGKAVIYGNAVRQVSGVGIAVQNNDTAAAALVTVDSNVVAASAKDGIQVQYGAARITRTRVTGSKLNGVEFNTSTDTARSSVRRSFLAGNRFGVQAYGYAFHADSNWWGDPNGPQCSDTTCVASTGDSISLALIHKPFLTDTSTLTVPAAPRAFALAGLSARAAVPAAAGPSLHGAPLARRAAPPRPSAVTAFRAPGASRAQPSAPRGLGPARLRGQERMADLRQAQVRGAVQRAAALEASRAQRESAREVRAAQREQQRAAREAGRR